MKHLVRFGYIYNGLLVAIVALSLLMDRTFFFYPPSLASVWNNPIASFLGLAAGLGLTIYGIINKHSNFISGLLLGTSAGYLTWLLCIEAYHGWRIGYDKFTIAMVFEAASIGFIMVIAYLRNPKKQERYKR